MIPAYAILSISFVCLVFSFLLFQRAAGSMSVLRLNTISYIFYFQILTTGFVGSVLLALGKIDWHYLAEPLSDGTKTRAWAWVMYSIIALPIAMNMVNAAFKVNARKEFATYIKKPLTFNVGNKQLLIILGAMTLVAMVLIAYVVYYTDNIPLMTLLKGNLEQARADRVHSGSGFRGSDYIKGLFTQMLVPVFSYFSMIVALNRKKLVFWLFAGVLFALAVFITIYDTQKAPLAFFLLGVLIVYTMVKGGISPMLFAVIVGSGIAAIVLGYVFTADANFFDQITRYKSGFYGRLFISGYMAFPLSLEFFPSVFNDTTVHLSGIPLPILRHFGIHHVESARLLMTQINPEGVADGTANLVSGYYMGEAWANYGYAGLIVAPFVVGVVVQLVHVYLLRNAKHPLLIAFYAYVTVKWLLGAGFVTFLYLKIIMFPFIMYLLVRGALYLFRRQTA